MRAGCLDLAVRIVVASLAAVLTVLGVVLLLSVLFSSPAQTLRVENVVKVVAALVAGYSFYLIGKSVWRDIKKRSSAEPEDGDPSG
jgi:uncharacterized membrane-anchored protein